MRPRFADPSTRPDGEEYRVPTEAGWGGYGQRTINHDTGNGTSSVEVIGTSTTDAVDRYRGMADQYGDRDAYQLNFGQANLMDRAMGEKDRGLQNEATALARDAALGRNNRGYEWGKTALNKGLAGQQSAALTTRGDALSRMNAVQRANTGANQFRQTGMQGLEAQKANDMAQGRLDYANYGTATRNLDQTSQRLAQEQAEAQAQSEMKQREMNQAGQMGFEKMGFDTTAQGLGANRREMATAARRREADRNKQEADDARAVGYVAAGAGAFGSVATTLGKSAQSADAKEYNDNYTVTSDKRAKVVSKDPLADLARTSMAAMREGLSYGPSVGGKKDEPDRGDVDSIRGDYDRGMFHSDEADGSASLHRSIESRIAEDDVEEDRPSALQYTRGPDRGVGGAPKGYAESRRGQGGFMFGGPEKRSDYDDTHGVAPGTRDFLKYGSSGKKADKYSKAVSLSDKEAKEKVAAKAFIAGQQSSTPTPPPGLVDKLKEGLGYGMPVGATVIEEAAKKYREHERANQPAPKIPNAPAKQDAKPLVVSRPMGTPMAAAKDPRAPGVSPTSVQAAAELEQIRQAREQAATQVAPKVDPRGMPVDESLSDDRAKDKEDIDLRSMRQDANRKMAGQPYRYKDGVGEDPERLHMGYMAQDLASNPLTALAVQKRGDGMLTVDNEEMTRQQGDAISELQKQIDEMRGRRA